MSWLLNVIYGGLLLLLSPMILWKMLRHGRYRRGLKEKLLGRLPQPPADRPVIWFHAVSVGEVIQLHKVVVGFRKLTANRFHIVITTSTDTGYDLAVSRFTNCTVTWFPLDFSWAVSAALKRIGPQLVVLTELEFWPGFLSACRKQNIATAVVNARMSDRSFRGYRRIRRLVKPLLSYFSGVAAQTEQYAKRLMQLGARTETVSVTGSLKFDGVETRRDNPATRTLRSLFGVQPSDIVLIAGSTQEPEEQMAVAAWQTLRLEFSQLRLILVPRHRERFQTVADLLQKAGIACVRRSALTKADQLSPDSDAVILLDTIGVEVPILNVGGIFPNQSAAKFGHHRW